MPHYVGLTLDADEMQLDLLLNRAMPETPVLRLFINDLVPSRDGRNTVSDFEEAPLGYGYAPTPLESSKWTAVKAQTGDFLRRVYPSLLFRFTGPIGNIFGYYVVGERSGRLMWSERFPDGPYNVQRSGHEIEIKLEVARERAVTQ